MKHLKNITLLTALAIILSGCNNQSTVSSSTTPTDSSSTSTSGVTVTWSDEQKDLMNNFLGELLPYPDGFEGTASVDVYGEGDDAFLYIIDESSVFSIKYYYEQLEKSGWTVIKDYNNNAEFTSTSGSPFFECIKSEDGSSLGFDLNYFYQEPTDGNEDFDPEPGGNVVAISKYSSKLSEDSYSDNDEAILKEVLTELPPQLKLAQDYSVNETSNINYAIIEDSSVLDLRKDNVNILKNAGYEVDTAMSQEEGFYTLYKMLADYSVILVCLDFFRGNYIEFQYLPSTTKYKSWPAELDDDLVDKYGAVIPEFKDENVDDYEAFVKNGLTFIYQEGADASSISETIEAKLYEAGLVCDNYGNYYYNWDEEYFVALYTDNDTFAGIVFGEKEKEHSYVNGYTSLSSSIDAFLTKQEITASLPSFASVDTLASSSTFRCEEDEEKITIAFHDVATRDSDDNIVNKVKEYLYKTFDDACWYKDSSSWEYDNYYENEDGSLGVGFSSWMNMTVLTIEKGSGVTHKKEFYFDEKSVNMFPGQSGSITLKVSMLPDSYTIESNNPLVTVDHNGYIEVDSTIEVGTKVTITAKYSDTTLNVEPATCIVTITKEYTNLNAVEEVLALYTAKTGDTTPLVDTQEIREDYDDGYEIYYTYTLNLSPSEVSSTDDAKTFVDGNLIPLGFETLEGEDWTEYEEDGVTFIQIQYSYYDIVYNSVQLYFAIYQDSDGNITIKAKTRSDTEWVDNYDGSDDLDGDDLDGDDEDW